MNRAVLDDVLIGDLIAALPELAALHAPHTPTYKLFSKVAASQFASFGPTGSGSAAFGPFGRLEFPYFEMGAINSLHLFGLDELIIFSFYNSQRSRYRKVADIGANIGLHSIMLSLSGYEVRSYEPDPVHFDRIQKNLAANHCKNVTPINAAVSTSAGNAEFVRVLGNTTGSHLAGAKSNAYGDLERFEVRLEAIAPIMEWADFIKMDVEGHEANIIAATSRLLWDGADAMIEVGTAANAAQIFDHLVREKVDMYAQKIGWEKVASLADMPTSYRDGSLFISTRNRPWT